MISYNWKHKRLGIENKVLVTIPLKTARRITILSKGLEDRKKKE